MKINQRVAITKRLLQESLMKILETKPLDKVSITELCGEAGINRATFYRHYNLPRDVLLDMQQQFVDKIQSKYSVARFNKSPEAFVEEICTVLYDNADFIKISIKNNLEDNIINLSCTAFQNYAKNNNLFNKTSRFDENDLKLLVAYVSGGSYFMIRQWLLEDIDKSPKEISKMVLSVLDVKYLLRS